LIVDLEYIPFPGPPVENPWEDPINCFKTWNHTKFGSWYGTD